MLECEAFKKFGLRTKLRIDKLEFVTGRDYAGAPAFGLTQSQAMPVGG
ncbi:hypothetical protein X738_30150 [Mesorhizobium sp. LNHC209A00]|nr:hypothetical protein X738_30150 [Mesorhizobium sp. LNHC209A00]